MKTYKSIEKSDLDYFLQLLGPEKCSVNSEDLEKYGQDETEGLVFLPELVLKPSETNEVSAILKYCYQHNICVTPRGAGTGLSGGALPVHGGISLSTEKMNKILYIDEKNLQVLTQPGVITQVLQETVAAKGLYYPPDPSSRGSCFIGGNIAENSGGPRAVKYGVTKDYVLALEVVLPNGDIINTGAATLKNSTGYNLTQLFVGSEGTLGIVTKIHLKLVPLPSQTITLLASFRSAEKACEAVSAIFRAGIVPSALEFMEKDAIDWTLHYKPEINISVDPEVQGHLLIELDGNDMDYLMKQCEDLQIVLDKFECKDLLFAESTSEKDALWKLRRSVAEAVKSNSIYKEEDTVVPRYYLPQLLKGVKEIGAKYGFKSVCYGHAGDGNLHVNIIKGDLAEEFWNRDIKKGIREIFELTVKLGGTLSGEHGIGWVQKEYMDIAFSEKEIEIQRKIKDIFDPKGILNPSKILPDA
ncbi:MAG TPA: FAD-linked oxidase C-terminal domain-containing protein [Bacteroidia bacterium]